MDVNREAPAIAAAEAYIDAPPSVVWSVQSNLREWPAWNSDVASLDVDGPLAPGTEFKWTSGGTPIRSTIQEVERERRIGWTGRAPLGIRAVHTWTFTPEGDGTRVRTEESFEGLLVRLFVGPMQKMLDGALGRSLSALKTEAERRSERGAA
ncbi:SRPBCC family protein [Rubrivirga sp. IMCC45206]|uniref:SRPBCC family protein n=1 Tax=Rubrivirga sp. IMCC45206 TaxID=3391614 RepID=UPI00398F9598